jgi:hypothetical protein
VPACIAMTLRAPCIRVGDHEGLRWQHPGDP